MEKPITFTLDNRTIGRSMRLYQWRSNWGRAAKIQFIGLLILLPPVLAWLFLGQVNWRNWAICFGAVLAFLLAIILLWPPVIGWLMGRRALEKQPVLRRGQEMSWDDGGLRQSDDVGSNSFYRWNEIRELVHDRHCVLLFIAPRMFLPVPRRALSDAQLADLIATAGRNGVAIWPKP